MFDVDVSEHRNDAPACRVEQWTERVDEKILSIPTIERKVEQQYNVKNSHDRREDEVNKEKSKYRMPNLDALVHSGDSNAEQDEFKYVQKSNENY